MAAKVLVVDYGIGNVRSVCRAFEYCGAEVELSDDPKKISGADRVVLPGVGAINHCFDELRQRNMIEHLTDFTLTERPLLGICVGMQMMMDTSWEFKEIGCFGWISGKVVEIPHKGSNGVSHKIPHIGWSNLELPEGCDNWEGSILQDLSTKDQVYFVHSFMALPKDKKIWLAETKYDGTKICAAVNHGSLTGTQFHPEKSGKVGLKIIQNFLTQ
jgi:imidazole glycerol-phosphate synthase subunit HisH